MTGFSRKEVHHFVMVRYLYADQVPIIWFKNILCTAGQVSAGIGNNVAPLGEVYTIEAAARRRRR